LASNDPPRVTASSENWFAELDAHRLDTTCIGAGLIATDRSVTDRMDTGQPETARRECVGELLLLDRGI
jgi:hypothetical protein